MNKTKKELIIEIIQKANDKFWNESEAEYVEDEKDEELTEAYFENIADKIIKALSK